MTTHTSASLGKLIAIHSTSPAFLQRAAIVAGLSFLFFLLAMIFYLVRESFLYFVLSTGFLVVLIFTMIGWWMQRRGAVTVYSSGIVHRGRTARWDDITGVARSTDGGLRIGLKDGGALLIPLSIQGLDRIEAFVKEKL